MDYALALGQALLSLKGMFDQHKANKQEIKELQDFIEQYHNEIPALQRCFKDCQGNDIGSRVVKQLEVDITDAIKTLQTWSAERSFFRHFSFLERMAQLQKLHRNLMASLQKNLHLASISMLIDIRASQETLRGDLSTQIKSSLIQTMGALTHTLAAEVKVAVSEASHTSFADEKFWADILEALDSREEQQHEQENEQEQELLDMFVDPILQDLMVDPIVASNGITYCRWTILDNHVIQDPHNPSKGLIILGDNVSLRGELFKRFPNQYIKFQERRALYRQEALELAEAGQLVDAKVALEQVLQWNKADEECAAELAHVRKEIKTEHDALAHVHATHEESKTEHDGPSTSAPWPTLYRAGKEVEEEGDGSPLDLTTGLAEVTHAFEAEDENELSLAVGDIVYVRRVKPSCWAEGGFRTGKVAWFPTSYVQPYHDTASGRQDISLGLFSTSYTIAPDILLQQKHVDVILQTVHNLKQAEPAVARICCEYLLHNSYQLDPHSSGRSKLQFKTYLQFLLKELECTDRSRDVYIMRKYYTSHEKEQGFDQLGDEYNSVQRQKKSFKKSIGRLFARSEQQAELQFTERVLIRLVLNDLNMDLDMILDGVGEELKNQLPVGCLAQATLAFIAQNSNELNLALGDYVFVLQGTATGWSLGVSNGKEGYFPTDHVKKIRRSLESRST